MYAPTSPPSFISVSPSDSTSQRVTLSTSFADGAQHAGTPLISPHYLPPWASASSGYTEKELSTNAPATPPPKSRSVTPRLMDQSSFFSPNYEKENEVPGVRNARLGGPPTKLVEGEGGETSRVVRGRILRVNTLHQRVYHNQYDLSPLPYPPIGFSPHFEPSSISDVILEKESLPLILPPIDSPSKTRFQHNSSSNRLKNLFPNFPMHRILSLPDSSLAWLALYFILNLSLTLYNKSVLIHFPFPYTLTALHALCGTIGTFVLLRLDAGTTWPSARASSAVSSFHQSPMPNLNGRELVVVFLFSILYTINIVVSNASLRLVTVPFHQVVRASTPFFTITFAAMLLGRRCSKRKLLSLIPVVVGVGFATYGDYYFTAFGFFLTLLGTLLAALKTILTNVILVKPTASELPTSASQPSFTLLEEPGNTQSSFPPSFFSSLVALTISRIFPPSPSSSPAYPIKSLSNPPPLPSLALPKLSLSPIHLLYLLSPLAFIQTTLLAHFTGELDRVRWHLFNVDANGRMWLLLNGVLAFFLNVVSFNANRRVGPLGMSVAANVKQVLTILCAVVIFDLMITPANGLGIALTLLGGALYAAVELREKEERKSRVG